MNLSNTEQACRAHIATVTNQHQTPAEICQFINGHQNQNPSYDILDVIAGCQKLYVNGLVDGIKTESFGLMYRALRGEARQ